MMHSIRELLVIYLLSISMVLTGCECCEMGSELEPVISGSITMPTDILGGSDATWSATWEGGIAPYSVTWDFGGGASPNSVVETTSGNSHTTTASMINNTTELVEYSVTLNVTDSLGSSLTKSDHYYVIAENSPMINSAYFDETTSLLSVVVSSPLDDEILTVSLTMPSNLQTDATSKVATQTGPFSTNFHISATNPVTGGNGDISVTVTDSQDRTDQTTVSAAVNGYLFATDTLYVIPMVNTAHVGDSVSVMVVTGPTTHPFRNLYDVTITYDNFADYVMHSFNHGDPGENGEYIVGDQQFTNDVDGIWAYMDITEFLGEGWGLYPPYTEDSDSGIPGRDSLSFHISPLNGIDLVHAFTFGVLCNFQVTFNEPGTVHFGLLQVDGPVARTCYSDGTGNQYQWSTLMAGPNGVPNVMGLDNSILVAE